MEQFLIYLWNISEGIRFLLFFVALLSSSVIIYLLLVSAFNSDFEWDKAKSYVYKGATLIAVFLILCTAIPSKQDLALIFLYPSTKQGTLNVVQSDTTKKMVEVFTGLLEQTYGVSKQNR